MKKDITIIDFIEKLKSLCNFKFIKIVDNWSADLCAIGIKKEDKLIYISTFNYINELEIKYDFDLELINKSNETKIDIIKEGRGISESELINEIKTFFEV